MARTWQIGEVAEHTGLSRRTLRHYDDLGLLVPSARSSSDYRIYDETDLSRLLQIQNLKALGLSLTEIATVLADPSVDANAALRSHLALLESQINAERQLAERLRRLAETAEHSWKDVLAAIAAVRRLTDPDPMIRLRAAFTQPGTTSDLLDALAGERDPAVREVIIWAIAQRPDATAETIGRLADADHESRIGLTRVLGKLRDRQAIPLLIELLTDPEPEVVTIAVQTLGQFGDAAAVPHLVSLISTGGAQPSDLIEAIAAVGEAALPALTPVLRSPSEQARAAAAEIIGRLRDGASTGFETQTAALLEPLLHDPDPAVRLTARLAARS